MNTLKYIIRHRKNVFFYILIFTSYCFSFFATKAEPISVPRLSHPGGGQIFYFVLTDRFFNGNPNNDTGYISGDSLKTGFDPTQIGYYHGGDLKGLTQKLDYIKTLGVTAIWITPPFKNKAVQITTVPKSISAGYHGYWITDFNHIDPHLGTEQDFKDFITKAHAKGLRVFIDIVVNHTADVIHYQGTSTAYKNSTEFPYRDKYGKIFDPHQVAYNGINVENKFPELSTQSSFPYVPYLEPSELHLKNPEWLNDVTLYHNRGDSTFKGESSLFGDFAQLDDLFTENPRVVKGFIEIYSRWMEEYGFDGYRIDTIKHVNLEFWQAFLPAIRAKALELGRPDFFQFGEVAQGDNIPLISLFTTSGTLDASLDFGVYDTSKVFFAEDGLASNLYDLFNKDAWYLDHDSCAQNETTFVSNHDGGRLAYFISHNNPKLQRSTIYSLNLLGYVLLFTIRGQPIVYYGDEQGMIGLGDDQGAREDMFASLSPAYQKLPLLGTERTGKDDKFDTKHPLYKTIQVLANLRKTSPGLKDGAMILRPNSTEHLFAFSRIDRSEQIEYLVAINNSRTKDEIATLQTSQEEGEIFDPIFTTHGENQNIQNSLTVDSKNSVKVKLSPMQSVVWKARRKLSTPKKNPIIRIGFPNAGSTLSFSSVTSYGQILPERKEIIAFVAHNDGFAEVTFTMKRASRPGQSELLGVSDSAPYHIFWRPPADLSPDEKLTFTATVNDLRGHIASDTISQIKVKTNGIDFGIKGSTPPVITQEPGPNQNTIIGGTLNLTVCAKGTQPFEYHWIHDGAIIPNATNDTLYLKNIKLSDTGRYQLLIHNREGTTLSSETKVSITQSQEGALEVHPNFESKQVTPREVDIWLPPGYNQNTKQNYPVIYMHDGQNLFSSSLGFGGHTWLIDRAIENHMREHNTPGAIVVGIWNSGETRAAEYMPQKSITAKDILDVPFGAAHSSSPLKADAYLKFIVQELKPYIDQHFRTKSDKEHTSIMGSSMGGLISIYALCEYPDVFGSAACLSSHWPAGNGSTLSYLKTSLPNPSDHKIYFDHGTETLDAFYDPYQISVDEICKTHGYKEGFNYISKTYEGDEHSEVSWSKRLSYPLNFILKN